MWIGCDHDEEAEAGAFALATLGVVALLLSLLSARVLPRLAGCGAAQPMLLRLQCAMTLLAALAWREVEAPSADPRALDAMEAAALRMQAALADLMAVLARLRIRRSHPASGLGPASPGLAPCRAALPCAPSPRARDGPARTRA